MPFDKFGNPLFFPSKSGGFFYEQSNNPKNDDNVDWPSEMSFSGNIATMHPNGPTDFGIGKNIKGFSDSIGGCKMDFAATAKRGYGYKADDARDIEYKCWMKVTGSIDGISISTCTGHHSGSGCCQGFAYMGSMDGVNSNPTKFRFRKETLHVEYTDSSEGTWSHPKCNFKVSGHDWIGFGFCRYNKPSSGGTSPQDDTVILEIWFNPDPTNSPEDWTMLKRTEDKPGRGWTGSKGKCNGDNDQIGVWSNAQNRIKTNATSGSIQFTAITLREINPFGTFDQEPPSPNPCPAGQHRGASGNCEPDTVNCPPGQHQDSSGNCVDDEPGTPPPSEPTKVKGFFTLKRDINIYRTDACEGTGGGGGSGGSAQFYSASADNTKELSDTTTHFFRTRLALQINKTASGAYNKVLKQMDVPLKKVGSPPASPVVSAAIWDKNNNVIYTSPTTIDPTTLTTSFVTKSFDFSANTHIFVLGDRVGVRYFYDGSDADYVAGGYAEVTSEGNTTMIQYQSSVWKEFTLRDWAATLWS